VADRQLAPFPGRVVPLEQLPAGEFDPQYRLPLDARAGEISVLPLSINGAVAMAHLPEGGNDGYVAGDEFFVYKFERWRLWNCADIFEPVDGLVSIWPGHIETNRI
jgi:hypothetical protein